MRVDAAALERECRIFTRLLVRSDPSAYVTGKYIDAHGLSAVYAPARGVDRALATAAGWSPVFARVADAYARLFFPQGALRQKLVLLLAILETSPASFRAVTVEPPQSPAAAVLRLGARGVAGTVAALAGVCVFGPLHVLAPIWARRG